MLGQGCLRALCLENNLFPRKLGLNSFCQWAEMGPKVGFWVQKWVKTYFWTTYAHFGISAKTHFLGGVEIVL